MKSIFTAVFFIISSISIAQTFEVASLIKKETNGIIEGVLIDSDNNDEPLVFATVAVKEANIEVETNMDGSYAVSLKPGWYTLEFSFIGYNRVEVANVEITSDNKTIINQTLSPMSLSIQNSITQIEK